MVANRFDRRSGPDFLVHALVSGLDRAEWAPRVILIDFSLTEAPSLLEERLPGDVPLVRLPWNRGRGLPAVVAAISRAVREHGVALAHSHDIPSHLAVALARWRLARRRPAMVASVHGVVDQTRRQRFWNRLNRMALPSFDRIVIGSPVMRPYLGFLPMERIDLVWNAVDVAALGDRGDVPSPPGFPFEPGAFPLICVARLSREKGHAFLLEALAGLRRDGVDARLTLIGEGPERAALERQASALNLAGAVTFEGFVGDIRPYLRRARVLVLPSIQESLPLVVLEAMAMAVPVLTTTAGAMGEVVTNGLNGRLVPPGDAGALRQALHAMASNPAELESMGQAGPAAVADRFAIPRFVASMAGVYRAALGGRA